ncbi:hypothetical protein Taro_045424 [Colocasia esculenta]|uniref:Uncharacterized protein n=1 Tax=Colocasia esculenta TaxID=4460 RepID=A0A843X469_COLES|nr:hypothetical protein [Colocasia esculenta]
MAPCRVPCRGTMSPAGTAANDWHTADAATSHCHRHRPVAPPVTAATAASRCTAWAAPWRPVWHHASCHPMTGTLLMLPLPTSGATSHCHRHRPVALPVTAATAASLCTAWAAPWRPVWHHASCHLAGWFPSSRVVIVSLEEMFNVVVQLTRNWLKLSYMMTSLFSQLKMELELAVTSYGPNSSLLWFKYRRTESLYNKAEG